MAPKLYMFDLSPPVRSILLTAEALGITLEHHRLDLSKKEHLTPEFLKLNPQHTVPTLDDNGEIYWDRDSIIVYLVGKYGKDDFLYPKDIYTVTVMKEKLNFESVILFPTLIQIVRPIVREGAKSVPPEKVAYVIGLYGDMENFLKGRKWAAGDNVTLADLSLIPTVTSISVLVPIDKDKFPNITTWIERAQNLPYYDVDRIGLERFKASIESKLNA